MTKEFIEILQHFTPTNVLTFVIRELQIVVVIPEHILPEIAVHVVQDTRAGLFAFQTVREMI